jgi:hypothetical protein
MPLTVGSRLGHTMFLDMEDTVNSIETLATFFGWCIVLNIGVLLVAVLLVSVAQGAVGKINAKLFGVTDEEAKVTFFRVIQQYRVAVAVLNVVPYVALKIMA